MSVQPRGWDALAQLQRLQDAVLAHDRDAISACVSDKMIWVMPLPDNARGKRDWIDASCAISWDWFDIRVSRELDLGDTRVVEAWIRQQRRPTAEEVARGTTAPVAAEGVVVDTWSLEGVEWRLTSRHPQRAQD